LWVVVICIIAAFVVATLGEKGDSAIVKIELVARLVLSFSGSWLMAETEGKILQRGKAPSKQESSPTWNG
jgi:hypothetical protein